MVVVHLVWENSRLEILPAKLTISAEALAGMVAGANLACKVKSVEASSS